MVSILVKRRLQFLVNCNYNEVLIFDNCKIIKSRLKFSMIAFQILIKQRGKLCLLLNLFSKKCKKKIHQI